MSILYLVRHAQSTANVSGTLAGRSAGVALTATGRDQAAALGTFLGGAAFCAAVSSPLQRCQETLDALLPLVEGDPARHVDKDLQEIDYGDWTGRSVKELAGEPLWHTVIKTPSQAVFPGGEGLSEASERAVASVRRWDKALGAEHGKDAAWLAVSHGDVIKAILADALGIPLDGFQRIAVGNASVSVIRYDERGVSVSVMGATPSLHAVKPQVGGGEG